MVTVVGVLRHVLYITLCQHSCDLSMLCFFSTPSTDVAGRAAPKHGMVTVVGVLPRALNGQMLHCATGSIVNIELDNAQLILDSLDRCGWARSTQARHGHRGGRAAARAEGPDAAL